MTEQSKPQITVSSVLQDLKDGKTRDDIAEKYGISKAAVKRMFQHPQLKNKKTIKPKDEEFVLVDDVTETQEQAASETTDQSQPVEETTDEAQDSPEEAQDEQVQESDSNWSR